MGNRLFPALIFTFASCYSLLPISFFATPFEPPFPIRYSLFVTRLFFPCPFARGVRSAGGAWMPATHPDRHAMTGVQTPHRSASPSKRARLAFVAHHRSPVAAIDMRRPSQPARLAVRRLAYPGYGYARLAALHVGFLARARARRSLMRAVGEHQNRPSET